MTILPSLYDQHADEYEQLVHCEDYEGNLLRALSAIHPLDGAHVVEMGAGTGRVTCLLMPHAARIEAFDLSHGMLTVAAGQVRRARESASASVTLAQADSRALPLLDHHADLAIEGWSFAQIAAWNRDTWRVNVALAISEMGRVLRPTGTIILIETQGTGYTEPHPPADWFTELYTWFTDDYGFESTWIRTDFRFSSRDDAERLVGFFFKDARETIMAAAVITPDGACIVPECTGIWWREKLI